MTTENHDHEDMNEESFADLLEQNLKKTGKLTPGQKVEARVLKISGDWIFIDTGAKGEGIIDRKELLDAEGNLTVAEGETISAFFLSSRAGEMKFTVKMGGPAAAEQLADVYRTGVPVEGYVEKEVKGGFEVKIAGSVRAFCPWSQIDIRRSEASEFVGKHFSFRIAEYAERGRNIVVSRRALLEEEENRRKEELKGSLSVGMKVTGKVVNIRDFGAFVDLGGLQALIPISEAAWGRVKSMDEVLTVGQEVEAVIKQIDWDKNRISLSIRETLANPWERVAELFPEGSFHTGTVARLTPFGAFVTLAEGIDGLVHISKLGGGRKIKHPSEVVREGESVEVKIDGIDRDNRKISLALAGPAREAEDEQRAMADFKRKGAEKPAGMGTLGDLLKDRFGKK